jgi:hypothetical protein
MNYDVTPIRYTRRLNVHFGRFSLAGNGVHYDVVWDDGISVWDEDRLIVINLCVTGGHRRYGMSLVMTNLDISFQD